MYTSSKMSTTPAAAHAALSSTSHLAYADVSPACRVLETSVRSDGGDWLGWNDCSGLTRTAAISLPRALRGRARGGRDGRA